MSEKKELKAGDVLLKEGDSSSNLYYLEQGTMGVFKTLENEYKQIGTIYAGELIGEMSFLDKLPRSATVSCLTDCVIVEIPSAKFEKIFASLPNWYQALIKTLLERMRKANQKVSI